MCQSNRLRRLALGLKASRGSNDGVQIADHTLDTADGPMRLYEAVPEGGASRAVIVIQEAFGVNDHIEDVTRRFADAGYHAVAPALFHRAGGGTAPYGDFDKVLPLYEGLTDDGHPHGRAGRHRAPARAAGSPTRSIGIVGFCMGGRVTFLRVPRGGAGRGGRVLRRRHRHRALQAVPPADRPVRLS